MLQKEREVFELLKPTVQGLGYALWGVEYLAQGKHSILRLFIDHENGISLDDCEAVSLQVSAVLDVEDPISGQYNLEVSSPGMDRILFFPEQYQYYCNELLQVWLKVPMDGKRKLKGLLKQADANAIVLEEAGEEVTLSFDSVKKAQVIPQF